MTSLSIPELSVVVIVGVSGAGKTTFCRKHFRPTEVLSSDAARASVSDDENDQGATRDAFEIIHFIAAKRLARGRLVVVDATSIQPDARKSLLALARTFHVLPVAIVLNLPEDVCVERNKLRTDRPGSHDFVLRQTKQLERGLRNLQLEGFRHIYELNSQAEIDAVRIERTRAPNNLRDQHGPFDLIGDVHGCYDELAALLQALGYMLGADGASHPDGRRAVFLGDIVDRGPRIVDCLRLVMMMVKAGHALCLPGNHEAKLLKKLEGHDVRATQGLERTLAELAGEPPQFIAELRAFLDGLISHYILDDGNLVAAHAGMSEALQGRMSSAVRAFALYGLTTGETDALGLPVRYEWAADYRGRAAVVYGHTPVAEAAWVNGTICIDTGCVYGGSLTALRWPERTFVAVKAARVYCENMRAAPESRAIKP